MPDFSVNQYALACIGAGSATLLLVAALVSLASSGIAFSSYGQPIRLIESVKQRFAYAYAPSVIYSDGLWHAYYCSSGTGITDWDNIRYSTAPDGIHWSAPVVILGTSDPVNERAACDPSAVYFNTSNGAHYYIFYTGNQANVQGVNFVARATSPGGPFLKLTRRNTWERNPSDPKIILAPIRAAPDNINWYGLGEPSVVVKDGKLYQWYTDTSSEYPSNQVYRVYLSISNDPADWSAGQPTNVVADRFPPSVDVKYDPATEQFLMFGLGNQHVQGTYVTMRTSKDGITWSDPITVIPGASTPSFAHNIGVTGSATGELDRNFVMVAYGAPYGLEPSYDNDCKVSEPPRCWGYWDLYGQLLKIAP